MKFIITSLLAFTSFMVSAQNSNMVFFSENGEKFTVYVNGILQNQSFLSNVKIENMPSAPYQIRIQFENPQNGVINDKVTLMPGSEKSWVIKPNPSRNSVNTLKSDLKKAGVKTNENQSALFVVRTFSEIPLAQVLPNNPAPQQQVVTYQATPPPVTTTQVNTSTPNTQVNQTSPDNFNMSMNMGGTNFNMNVNGTTTQTSSTTTTTQTNTVNGMQNGVTTQVIVPQAYGVHMCSVPLNPTQFGVERKKVSAQTTAVGRMTVAKKLSTTQCLTSDQVSQICKTIISENDRLTYAKHAYHTVYDPENYEVVFTAFFANASVTDLNNYIAGVSTTTTTTTTTHTVPNTTYQTQTTTVYVPGYTGPIGCPMPMNSSEFSAAKSTIESNSFENTKLSIAKNIVNANCLTADQIRQLTDLFSFESGKLEFAKHAYSHCYDKANYFKVSDSFDFESSKTELMEYISGK